MGSTLGLMAEPSKANTEKTRKKVTEFINGPTAEFMKETGSTENNTDLENMWSLLRIVPNTDFGKKERELSGLILMTST